jgi:hypothetical protein
MEQWKRFAFSNHGREAYFRMDRLRSGFLLCRVFRRLGPEAGKYWFVLK